MVTAQFESSDSFELQEPLSIDDARAALRNWHANETKLGFGYFRSRGGIVQTGTAQLVRVTDTVLVLDTQSSRAAIALPNARFRKGNLGLMTSDFRALYDIDGLSVLLENNDSLILFESTKEIDTLSLAHDLGRLR